MKIINRSTIIGVCAVVFTAVACTDSETEKTTPATDPIGLELNYSGWDNKLAAFKEGDKAGLFAVTGADRLTEERYVDNAEFVRTDGKFVGIQDIRFAKAASYLVAYAPYRPGLLPAGTQAGTVSVSKDQSSLYNFLNSDFKLGSAQVSKGSADPVKITLKRVFAKINLEISSTVLDIEDLKNAIAQLEVNTAAEVDFDTKKILGTSNPARIVPRGSFKPDGTTCRGVALIAVPQLFKPDNEFIHLKIKGEESSYALEEAAELKPGMEYTFGLVVNKVGNKYRIDIEITEEPWSAGDNLDFEVDQEVDEIRPVTDIEGNEYKVVKIGAQYWMASNLRTTKYNDGMPITYLEADAAWDKVSESQEGAWCYYQAKEAMMVKYGCLYNWHAVKTNKLCPEGWHVPSLGEFQMLFTEVGGDQFAGEVLKSTSGWKDYSNTEKPEYQGTNKSGFNGLASGYRAANGSYLNEGKYGYWWCSSALDTFSGNGVYLYFNKPAAVSISSFFRTGYSVRCVKY